MKMKFKHHLRQMKGKAFLRFPWLRPAALTAAVLAVILAIVLAHPAVIRTQELFCPYEENHFHTDACYRNTTSRVYVCFYSSLKDIPIIHRHDENCYLDGVLVCPMAEVREHVHTEECYEAEPEFMDGDVNFTDGGDFGSGSEAGGGSPPFCGQQERIPHVHDEFCYDAFGNLICEKPVVLVHQHSPECFIDEVISRELICTQPEGHVHTAECSPEISPLAEYFSGLPAQIVYEADNENDPGWSDDAGQSNGGSTADGNDFADGAEDAFHDGASGNDVGAREDASWTDERQESYDLPGQEAAGASEFSSDHRAETDDDTQVFSGEGESALFSEAEGGPDEFRSGDVPGETYTDDGSAGDITDGYPVPENQGVTDESNDEKELRGDIENAKPARIVSGNDLTDPETVSFEDGSAADDSLTSGQEDGSGDLSSDDNALLTSGEGDGQIDFTAEAGAVGDSEADADGSVILMVGADAEYETLQEAADAAQDGNTILLAGDLAGHFSTDKSVTLDLNGYTLMVDEANGIMSAGGTVTVLNGVIRSDQDDIILAEKGAVTLGSDLQIASSGSVIRACDGGVATIDGAVINRTAVEGYAALASGD